MERGGLHGSFGVQRRYGEGAESIEGTKQGLAGVGSGLRLESAAARALAPRAHGGQGPSCGREESGGGR